ncbi:hypothetical protein F7734_21995 [Scytonema sp. UIC 10036]|uniref:hypothetical protein n=1 Tax=Scytonema sp. UIC 10036 TaxID=2304196 RepID=UPI0012DA3823|nr:hypothetical protein [Scytonema sp. UIC 10036]MUG94889.1 hypothetical protein [Scytonema sp. UIC 10036]
MKIYHLRTFQDYETHIIHALSPKGFLFITNSKTEQDKILRQLAHEETQNNLGSWFSHAIATLHCPKETLSLAQVFPENGNTCPVLSEAEIMCFFQQLQANFSLSAIKFNNTCLSYISWLNCDSLTADELILKVQQFVAAAQTLKYIAERQTTSLLGINHSNEEYLIFSSLCLVFNDPGHFKALLPTVESIKFGNNSLPEFLFSGLKFLLTNIYKGSLFFDKVVYSSFDNQIASSQLIRGAGHFGCSLDELALK